MNLAAALAAEQDFWASHELERGTATLSRVSSMRQIEEKMDSGDGEAREKEREKGRGAVGSDSVCCVCMVSKKGAAFIPCGHTFCKVCMRELWLNQGSCPLCNRSILEILDIF
ncbi:hypothetical protein CIPAW_03G241000 [Carya illinoinensis]|uniref:RING-type domain-containing protein n=1 Tax=Carya illinoinensis TaxID=32201 RepID=A0A8T1R8J4_CARIL|nr:hypothetical protein CIPAW_03G241000 [Carya illinoinensis]